MLPNSPHNSPMHPQTALQPTISPTSNIWPVTEEHAKIKPSSPIEMPHRPRGPPERMVAGFDALPGTAAAAMAKKCRLVGPTDPFSGVTSVKESLNCFGGNGESWCCSPARELLASELRLK